MKSAPLTLLFNDASQHVTYFVDALRRISAPVMLLTLRVDLISEGFTMQFDSIDPIRCLVGLGNRGRPALVTYGNE